MNARARVATIRLPRPGGVLEPFAVHEPLVFERPSRPFTRRALAAAHVVADPWAVVDPWTEAALDWEATLAYRHHLWSWGLGVAEAMDTAQRGMGLDWPLARELARRSIEAARGVPGAELWCGVGTDHLAPDAHRSVAEVIAAYEEQCAQVEGFGGRLVIMASRALAACARTPDAYGLVYDRILSQVREPVILHWLGEMFDPALAGYWGSGDPEEAMQICLDVIARNAARVDGIKISLLDARREVEMRRRLPAGVRMYTGDDFNFVALIEGDGERHSDALLGIFDAIAPAASAALSALAAGASARYRAILAPTVPLARHVFGAPTRFYKTGIVFLAWLNGHQSHYTMVGGQQSARSLIHLAELFRLADAAGLLADPALACARMRALLAVHGLCP